MAWRLARLRRSKFSDKRAYALWATPKGVAFFVLGRHAHVEGKGGDKRARRRDGEGKWEEVRTLKWMEKKGSFWVKRAGKLEAFVKIA